MSLHARPYVMHDERTRLHSLGTLVSILANTEQTGGTFNLFDVILPTGFSTPLYINYADDIAIFVLKGAMEFFWGNEKMKAQDGSFFYQPRGIPHGFRVTKSVPARILYMTIPAGFDEFVIHRSRPTSDLEAKVSEAFYKIEILGSLPSNH